MASAEHTEGGDEAVDVMAIKEFDPSDMEKRLSFLPIDFHKLAAEKHKDHDAIRQQLGKSYNFQMRLEAKRLKSFISYDNLSTWCPKAMASAGFYFTGVKRSVQCFCCGLVFCNTSLRTPPYEDHVKYNPTCGFIQGREVGNIPKYEVRVQPSEKDHGTLQEYTAEELRLNSFAGWPFYTRIQPAELASAGFFFTGRRDTVQCFSCGGCLGNWEEGDDPWREHAKWFPECNFLASKKSPDEIKQYIKCYNEFSGFTGEHFTAFLGDRISPLVTQVCPILNIFEDEGVRLDSFKQWPPNAHADPAALARCGFYYTGISDAVKCFSCGVNIRTFEPGDDPYSEHLKYKLMCEFLHRLTNMEHKQKQNDQVDNAPMQLVSQRKEQYGSITNTGLDFPNKCWINEATKLKRQLVDVYNDSNFSKLLSFCESSHVFIDLKSLYADICVVSKDTRNQPLQRHTLPDILSDLRDITMIEGEAGSGKTALLRKIAILWASGCCPILSRFSLVFYISVSSIESQQTMADIICKQLIGPTTSLTNETLMDIMKKLKSQVLFLLDDYAVMDTVSEAIEELLLNNHLNRVSLAVTVRTDKGRRLRQYARTILSLQEFPLYSSIYMCRQLFSHDLPLLEGFVVELISSDTFQAALKTPLFTFALCVFWVQNPNENIASDISICKAYLLHNMLKHPKETETVKALVSSCGELALEGLFQSHFDFTDEDLRAACVNSDDALNFGLLSKFTSQRLRPIYKFFHPSFQEFLAGKRISDLLESEDKAQEEKGLSYLQQINTFLRVAGRYFYFLKYSCIYSSKTTSLIIFHLFALLNNSDAFDCQADTKLHLQHHPDVALREEMLTLLSSNQQGFHIVFVFEMLLDFAIRAAQEGKFMAACAPIILQFLKGKDISVDLVSSNMRLLEFLKECPEGLSLIRSLQLSITGIVEAINLEVLQKCFSSYWEVPTVDQDYSMAFQLAADTIAKSEVNNYRYYQRKIVDISNFDFDQEHHKIAVLKVEATGSMVGQENVIGNLMVFLPLTNHIELTLKKISGFVESVRPCIERYKDSFVKCSLWDVELSTAEQELITQMSSLESLTINDMQPPGHIFSHLDRFKQLKELTLNLSGNWEVFGMLPDGFKNLHSLEKLAINKVNLQKDSSRLAEFITNFSNLTSFHLNCDSCPEFEKVMAAISQNGKIQEISLQGLLLTNREMVSLASVLPSFKHLKVLNIDGLDFVDDEAAKILAQALLSLVQLEQLNLPSGSAIKENATSIVQKCQYLLHLRVLSLAGNILNDSSLMELAKTARDGHLSNMQKLDLAVNHDITQSGWRHFFLTLDNMPNLSELCITRTYTQQFKSDASTLIALVQCVSRLHSLKKLVMHGWLLDAKDIDMFNAMKQRHPQAKSFMLLWQWILPMPPVVNQ